MKTRENTGRPVTVEIGKNYLVETKYGAIVSTDEKILEGREKGVVPLLRDGYAAERIADI